MELWIALTLGAALIWAGQGFVDKYVLEKYTRGSWDFLFFSTLPSIVFLIGLLVVLGLPEVTIFYWVPIAVGIAFTWAFWLYAQALAVEDASQLSILESKMVPLITLIFGFLFLGQVLRMTDALAFVAIFVGLGVVTLRKRGGRLHATPGTGKFLLVLVVWAAVYVVTDWMFGYMDLWTYFTWETIGVIIGGFSLLALPQARKEIATGIREATGVKYVWFFASGTLEYFADYLWKKAILLAPSAAMVAIVLQTQSVFAIVIGIALTLLAPRIISEDISRGTLMRKVIGGLIMFGGVAALTVV